MAKPFRSSLPADAATSPCPSCGLPCRAVYVCDHCVKPPPASSPDLVEAASSFLEPFERLSDRDLISIAAGSRAFDRRLVSDRHVAAYAFMIRKLVEKKGGVT